MNTKWGVRSTYTFKSWADRIRDCPLKAKLWTEDEDWPDWSGRLGLAGDEEDESRRSLCHCFFLALAREAAETKAGGSISIDAIRFLIMAWAFWINIFPFSNSEMVRDCWGSCTTDLLWEWGLERVTTRVQPPELISLLLTEGKSEDFGELGKLLETLAGDWGTAGTETSSYCSNLYEEEPNTHSACSGRNLEGLTVSLLPKGTKGAILVGQRSSKWPNSPQEPHCGGSFGKSTETRTEFPNLFDIRTDFGLGLANSTTTFNLTTPFV